MMKLLILLAFFFMTTTHGHSIGDMLSCSVDEDCHNLTMCASEPCECFPFSSEILGPKCVKSSWAEKIRGQFFGSPSMKDIGPETCNQDRVTLGKWFKEHGGSNLISDPRPPLVTFLEEDPYEDPSNPPLNPDEITGFCAMQWQTETNPETGSKMYKLANFSTETEAIEAGWNITHQGHCGACSTLQDLGVYISQNLTDDTRECGLMGSILGQSYVFHCLQRLGFTDECSKIWQYNIKNTRSQCFATCIWSWITNEPLNKPDGSLNDCIQCDEDISGPNFKYFSGRTRRNSGIISAIHRPPESIFNITHCYWYGDLSF